MEFDRGRNQRIESMRDHPRRESTEEGINKGSTEDRGNQ